MDNRHRQFDSPIDLGPSLTPDEARRQVWDVLVVGAGPAGALAARELARRGSTVLLVDQASFPRAKVCGSCLNAAALATLHQVGLGDLVEKLGAVRLNAIELSAHGRRARLPLPAGAALSRAAFDLALVRAACKAGAAFLPRTAARVGPGNAENRRVRLHHGDGTVDVATRLVLAADGLSGGCLREELGFRTPVDDGSWIGAGASFAMPRLDFPPATIFMACGAGGYVGAVRLEDKQLNVAAAFDLRAVRSLGGPGAAAARIVAQAGWPPLPELAEVPWRGTPRLTRRPSRRAFPRALILGDAAGYVEPFTGEGMAWALAAAAAVAPLVGHATGNPSFPLGAAWEALYREGIDRRQAVCRWVTRLLHHPGLVGAVLPVLALMPGLAAPLVSRLSRTGPRSL